MAHQYIAVRALNHSSQVRLLGRVGVATPSGLAAAVVAGSGLTPATYYYKVTGIGDAGETTPSAEVSAVIATPTNEVQHVAVDATSGTFTLTFGGQTTSAIAFNASPTTGGSSVRALLEALSSIGTGNVAVAGSAGSYDVTFQGTLAATNVAQMTADSTSLAGNTHTATVTTTTQGVGTNEQVTLTWTADAGAVSYRIYRGTSTGAENHYQTSTTNSFTDAGAAGTVGTPPSSNTAIGLLAEHLATGTKDVVVDLEDADQRKRLNSHEAIGQWIISAVSADSEGSALTSNS